MEFFILRNDRLSDALSALPQRLLLQSVLLVVSMISFAGCGSDDGPKMKPIRGEVTYNGKPLTHGRVVYMPKDPTAGRQANGPIQSDGSFVLTTQEAGDGAIHGEYDIVIFSRGNGAGQAASREEMEAMKRRSSGSNIPDRYMSHETSELSDTVDGEHSGTKTIELTD